jgi:hypothetical protein
VVEDPVVEDPVVADPVVADPVVADPVVVDPVVVDPVVVDPVVVDPVVVVEDPVVAVAVEVAVVDPVVVAELPASPPRRITAPAVFGVARRVSSWIGMVMPGFGGSQGPGDSIGSSDSEFPGRGRSRSRLPFRPAS